jgi:hypothetical protein
MEVEEADLNRIEAELIRRFEPKLNTAHLADASAICVDTMGGMVKVAIREMVEKRGMTNAYQLQKATGVQPSMAAKW